MMSATFGEIAWCEVSRLSDDEMRLLPGRSSPRAYKNAHCKYVHCFRNLAKESNPATQNAS